MTAAPAPSAARAVTAGRICGWCRVAEIPPLARRDTVFCSQRCRQGAHRARSRRAELHATDHPLRLAYADPPYPGNAARHYGSHRDYAGEVDHRELLMRLRPYDGWALSTSARALPSVLALCSELSQADVRVAVWCRRPRPHPTARLVNGWEPVVFAGGRQVTGVRVADALVGVNPARRSTLPSAVIGAKPPAFCRWVFDLLGAAPGDMLDDLFPGSGMVSRAWDWFQGRDPSRAAARDESREQV